MWKCLVAVLPVLLLSGCGDDDAADELMTVTFDGASCVYDGPDEVTAGMDKQLRFANDSTVIAMVNMTELDEGRTADDIGDLIGPSGISAGQAQPEWAHDVGTSYRTSGGSSRVWEGRLEAAEHAFVCWLPDGEMYFGGGVTVVD